MPKFVNTLKLGTVLRSSSNLFRITDIIGQGSFGITYEAKMPVSIPGPIGSVRCEVSVAVKEFFMRDLCGREPLGEVGKASNPKLQAYYRERFLEEAHNLSQLTHPGIVRVMDRFEANGTDYYAMEFIEGINLGDFLKAHGQLNEAEALDVVRDVGEALAYMHDRRILHLDLKPGNVMRRWDGSLILIDFGLSKEYKNDLPVESASMALGTKGYAPPEQGKELRFSPPIDVYALGGVLYKLLTNEVPPPAEQIKQSGFPTYKFEGICSPKVQLAVAKAMMPESSDRPQTVREFLQLLMPDYSPSSPTFPQPSNLSEIEEGTRVDLDNPIEAEATQLKQPEIPVEKAQRERNGRRQRKEKGNATTVGIHSQKQLETLIKPAADTEKPVLNGVSEALPLIDGNENRNKNYMIYVIAAVLAVALLGLIVLVSFGGSDSDYEDVPSTTLHAVDD